MNLASLVGPTVRAIKELVLLITLTKVFMRRENFIVLNDSNMTFCEQYRKYSKILMLANFNTSILQLYYSTTNDMAWHHFLFPLLF